MSKKHLGYSDYKQLVGDNGVTEWVKYNWVTDGSLFKTKILKNHGIKIETFQTPFEITSETNKDCTETLIKVKPNTTYKIIFNGVGTNYDAWVCGYTSEKLSILDGTAHGNLKVLLSRIESKTTTFKTTGTTEYIAVYNSDSGHNTMQNVKLFLVLGD